MQAIPAMAVMPKTPGNAAQSAGAEDNGVSVDGVDFSTMLKVQIKGGRDVDAEIKARLDAISVELAPVKARLDAVSVELAPVEVGVQQENDSLLGESSRPMVA